MSGFLRAGEEKKQRGQDEAGEEPCDPLSSHKLQAPRNRRPFSRPGSRHYARCPPCPRPEPLTSLRSQSLPSPRVPTSSPPPRTPVPGEGPPPRSAAAWARSPARLGPFSVQHELAEAAPEGAAREQHRTQLHDQLQHPPSRAHLRRHLGEGQSAAASLPTGRPAPGCDTQLPGPEERRRVRGQHLSLPTGNNALAF